MKFLATNDELDRLERLVLAEAADPASSLRARIEIAWLLRERDTGRALCLVEALRPEVVTLSPGERQNASARLALVEAMSRLLAGRLPEARDAGLAALAEFESVDDGIGMCDALALVADAENGLGRTEERTRLSRRAATLARLRGDRTRGDLFDALEAFHQGVAGLGRAEATWRPFIDECLRSDEPAVRQHALDYAGNAFFARSEFLRSIDCYLEAARLAHATGQVRRRLISLANVGINCYHLGDFESALRFHQRCLEIARATGWPQRIGAALMLSAQALLAQGDAAGARGLADEAATVLAPLQHTQPYLGLQQVLGEIARAEGDLRRALEVHRLQERLAIAISTVYWQTRALHAQASVLAALGQRAEALDVAASAMALSRLQNAHGLSAEVLQCTARIHADAGTPAPPGSPWPTAAAHDLHEAFDLLSRIEGRRMPSSLLQALADEHARAHDTAAADDFARRAEAARQQEAQLKASHREMAAQLRHVDEHGRIAEAVSDPSPPGTT